MAAGKGDAVQKANDALGHRTHVVHQAGVVVWRGERLAPVLVRPVEILFQCQLAAPGDEHSVEAHELAAVETDLEPIADVRLQPRMSQRHPFPTAGFGLHCHDSHGQLVAALARKGVVVP